MISWFDLICHECRDINKVIDDSIPWDHDKIKSGESQIICAMVLGWLFHLTKALSYYMPTISRHIFEFLNVDAYENNPVFFQGHRINVYKPIILKQNGNLVFKDI